MCNLVHNKKPLLPRTHRPKLLAYSTSFLLNESVDSIRHRLDQRLKCPNCYRSTRPLKATLELINVLWLRIFIFLRDKILHKFSSRKIGNPTLRTSLLLRTLEYILSLSVYKVSEPKNV